jgi:multidrug efflux pump subunit AcrA (membrane-fusion protein)
VRTSPDKFEARVVRTGRPLDRFMEIESGLKAGDDIVTRGSFVLKSQLMKTALGE